MSAAIAAFFLLFLPTASAIAATCEANITRRSRHQGRKNQPSTGVEASTPRTRSADRGGSTEGRWKPKAPPALPSGRNRPNTTTTEPQDDTATNKDKTNKDQTTEARDASRGASGTTEKKKTTSSSELEEKTCQDMAIDAEEADTQTLKDTEKEKKEAKSGGRTGGPSPPGTGTCGPSQTGGGCQTATGTGAWPIGMSGTRTGPIVATKSSVFDVVEKGKDDVPSEFELDSVKRLQKMSRESCANTQRGATQGSKEVVVEISKGNPEKPPPAPSPKKPPKTKRDKKKEDEVRRWNAAIARGNVFRPRKDDETVDDVQADWGAPM